MQRGDLAVYSDEDADALEIVDQVVRHSLPEVGAAVEERYERAAAGEPDGCLGGRVPTADDTDPRGAAALGLLWPRGIEDADAFVRLDLAEQEAVGTRRGSENDGARRNVLTALEADEVVLGAGSSATARYGVAMRAPNFRAWPTARTVSSEPLMPAGKPR